MEHKPAQDPLLTTTMDLTDFQRTMAEYDTHMAAALARTAAALDQLDARTSQRAEPQTGTSAALATINATLVESETRRTAADLRMAEVLDRINTTLAESELRRTAADTRIAEILAASQEKIAASETRMAEAYVELGRILDRVIQTTDRTEQMTARLLASLAPEKVSH